MEQIILVLSVITLVSNLWFFKRMLALTESNGPRQIIVYSSPVTGATPTPLPSSPTNHNTPLVPEERYSAWVNRTNIPQTSPTIPAPPLPPRVSGPLERPAGFV